MSLERWFRLSGYLTLGLACSALVFAETPFLPDLQLCLAPVLVLLLLAWWLEGRWSLPAWGANLLGALIAVGGLCWLATQWNDDESLLVRIPLHLALLPYVGPLLIATLLVQAFRPRGANDFWRLQGLGLMLIGLGCVLDGGPIFGSLLAAYFASALAAVTLGHRLASTGERPSFSIGWLLFFLLRWMPLVAAPAVLLFLLTPRRDSFAWQPLKNYRGSLPRLLGQSSDADEINLNGTGRVELDDEIAFRIAAAEADGAPKLDLSAEQRWRVTVLDWYQNGKWTMLHQMPPRTRRINQQDLPDLGAGQFFLTFTVQPRQAGGLPLAEPVCLGPHPVRLPVRTLDNEGRAPLFSSLSNVLFPPQEQGRREYHYHQAVPAGDELAARFARNAWGGSHLLGGLVNVPSSLRPALTNWTIALLHRLSEQPRYRLPERVRTAAAGRPESLLIDPSDWAAVADVLTDYLAHSGEFTYTLDLTHHDPALDPVLDFLVNVKQGHCERYATALALMLRSVGIPARVIKGYRGAESEGEGSYVVRHRHAHAWVEIRTPQPDEPEVYHWRALDPTPAQSAAASSHFSLAYLWQESQRIFRQAWQNLIVNYNADEQADLWDSLKSLSFLAALRKLGGIVLTGLTALAALVLLRRLWRRRLTGEVCSSETVVFYRRLVRLLGTRVSLWPSFGQTPREYGEAARALLLVRPAWVELAELPLRVVELFYRVRFGGQPLTEEERRALDADLDRLTEALRKSEPRP
jgi:hypothetical protein